MRLAVLIHLASLVAATLVADTDINSTQSRDNSSPSSRHDGPLNDVRRSRVRFTGVSANHERDGTKEPNWSTEIDGRNCRSGETHCSSFVNTNSELDGDLTSTTVQRFEATNPTPEETVYLVARARKKTNQSTPRKKKAPKTPAKPATKASTRKSSRIAAQNASTRQSSRIAANASNRNAAKNASTRKSSRIAANASNRKGAKSTSPKASKPPIRASGKTSNKQSAKKDAAKKGPAKKGTQKKHGPVSAIKNPTGPVAKDLDLLAEIRKFNMATEFSFSTTSKSSTNMIDSAIMSSLKIPSLDFAAGDFQLRPRKKQLYQVRSKMAFNRLKESLPSARHTIGAAKELKLNEDMLSRLFDPTIKVVNEVLESIFKQKLMWKQPGSKDQPIPDYIFGTARPLVVFELKTGTTFTKGLASLMVREAQNYKFDASGTKLMRSGSGRGQAKDAKMLQQVLAEMFYHDVKWGILTNLEDWVIVEYNDSTGEIYLSHLPGSSVTTSPSGVTKRQSKALDIMLAVSMTALGKI